MLHPQGEPVKGVIHSGDASAGSVIAMYTAGGETARTLQSYEMIVVETLEVVVAVAGDYRVYFGTTATPGTGSDIARGTFAVNGGIALHELDRAGKAGESVWVLAPASGVIDVIFTGYVINGQSQANRPNWRESLVAGQ